MAIWKRWLPFHTVCLELHGESRVTAPKRDLDIADLFSERARRLGFEAPIGTYGGLWSTNYDYDAQSLLEGDFLARGLRLGLECSATCPVPVCQIFTCLQDSLTEVAEGTLSEVGILVNPYSVGMKPDFADVKPDVDAWVSPRADARGRLEGNFTQASLDTGTQKTSWVLKPAVHSLPEIGVICSSILTQCSPLDLQRIDAVTVGFR